LTPATATATMAIAIVGRTKMRLKIGDVKEGDVLKADTNEEEKKEDVDDDETRQSSKRLISLS
jgi:hypothetical protein